MALDGMERTDIQPVIDNLVPAELARPEPASSVGVAAEQPSRLHIWMGKKLVAGAIILPAAVGGAAAAISIAKTPASINTGTSGLSIEASPQLTDDLDIVYGPTFGIPKAHTTIGGVNVSVKLDITKLDTHESEDQDQVWDAVISDPDGTLGGPVKSAFIKRGIEGLAGGIGAFGLIAGLGFGLRRRKKRELETEQRESKRIEQIDELPDEIKTKLPEELLKDNQDRQAELKDKEQRRHKRRTLRKVGALALAASITVGGGAVINQDVNNLHPSAASRTVIFPENSSDPLIQEAESNAPVLKGLFVTGDVGYYAKQGIIKIIARKQTIDDDWKNAADYATNVALPAFREQGGMAWQADPNIVAFADLSDVHDNRSFLKNYLPQVLQAMGIDFVVNTGDEMNYSKKLFLDNGSIKRFADALPEGVPAVEVAGNHDIKDLPVAHKLTFKTSDGKTWKPIIPLDKTNNFSTTIDGITLVGSPDDNRTTPGGTDPSDPDAQAANDIKQGENLTNRACQIYHETNIRPIVLAHERQATYEAIAKGCVQLALSGHLHETLPTRAYISADGSSITIQQNIGSASGDGPNNTTAIYNYATIPGDIIIWLYNKETHQLVSHNIYIHIDPNSPPTITSEDLPDASEATPALDNPDIQQALSADAPDVYAQLEAEQAQPGQRTDYGLAIGGK